MNPVKTCLREKKVLHRIAIPLLIASAKRLVSLPARMTVGGLSIDTVFFSKN